MSSDLPLGSGLGSSASFCVSISSAFLALSDAISTENKGHGWLTLGESELELINKWAYEGEKIIHGKPSGIDNSVSTFGMYAYSHACTPAHVLISAMKWSF